MPPTDVLNVGGVDIPGTYQPPSVLTPSTPVTPPATPATTPATKTSTKPSLMSMLPFLMPSSTPAAPQPAPLANVFYYGKDFTGQEQKIGPSGELMMTPYNDLSVTQAGAEPEPQAIPVAQEAKGGENDISALLQQIMSSGDNNMTQEELMQIIQARG